MDQLYDYMKAHSKADVVDVRPALIAARADDVPDTGDLVYFPLGTHWSRRGAIVAYNAIADRVRACLPAMPSWPLSGYNAYVVATSRL